MEQATEIIVTVLLVLGGFFGLVGNWGLVRLPDQMTRLHAPTKASTLGVGAVLFASMIWFWTIDGHYTWHEFLIVLFLFMTAPITGHFIAKAHMHISWRPDELPHPGRDAHWATYGSSAERGATTELDDDNESAGPRD